MFTFSSGQMMLLILQDLGHFYVIRAHEFMRSSNDYCLG